MTDQFIESEPVDRTMFHTVVEILLRGDIDSAMINCLIRTQEGSDYGYRIVEIITTPFHLQQLLINIRIRYIFTITINYTQKFIFVSLKT